MDERIEDTRRKERNKRDDRIRRHVKLLINPPELYERMEPNVLRQRRKKKRNDEDDTPPSRPSRQVSATEVLASDNGVVSATPNPTPLRRSVRNFIFGRRERKNDDEKVVEGRDK